MVHFPPAYKNFGLKGSGKHQKDGLSLEFAMGIAWSRFNIGGRHCVEKGFLGVTLHVLSLRFRIVLDSMIGI